MRNQTRTWLIVGGTLALGVPYGVLVRLLMVTPPWMEVLSIGFLFVAPFVIGFLTGAAAPRQMGVLFRLFFPCATVGLFVAGTALLALEGAICIVMMLPVALVMAVSGGAASLAFFPVVKDDWREGPPRKPYTALLLAPLLVGFVETRVPLPDETREVWSRIEIAADAPTVWAEIVQVPLIAEHERRPGFFHDIGFPYPLEARIDGEGVGAVRHASFEGGILFEEVVTEWVPNERLAFTIDVDPDSIPTTTLDRHVTIGGRTFDTLEGVYRIETHPDGFVTLHLGSRHRLSTRFNAYAGLWTDAVMASIQEEILQVIHDRAEAAR